MNTKSLSAVLALAAALSACDSVNRPRSKAPFDTGRLESAIDANFGGVGTCVVVLEAGSGASLYRYGAHSVCDNPLPPCATFEVANLLVALERNVVNPTTVLKWDKTRQPVSAWQRDFAPSTAFQQSVAWWDKRVALQIGPVALGDALRMLDYGDAKTGGPADGFWLGPSVGGQLGVTTTQQAQFMARLARGALKVRPRNADFVQSLMVDETRGGSVLMDKAGSCASQPDQSRQVSWWIGRLKTPEHDYAFAASLEGSSEDALPGAEIRERGKRAFSSAGMWPTA